MKPLLPCLGIIACAGALVACGGSNNSPAPSPTPCSTPSGDTTVLVYPAPSSTSVPGTFGQIIIGSTTALGSNYNVVVTDAINPQGIPGGNLTTATPPFPTPNATPAFPNPHYESSSYAGAVFGANQVISIFVNIPSSGCTPVGPVGSFST